MMKIIIAILYYFMCMIQLPYILQHFQQNHYHINRQCTWIKKQVKQYFISYLMISITIMILGVLTNMELLITCYSILLGVISYIIYKTIKNKKNIIPLKYTSRTKRYIIGLNLFIIVIITLSNMIINIKNQIYFFPLFSILPWILLFPVHYLLLPIEKSIKKYFRKQAEDKLKKMAGILKIGITGSYGKTSVKNMLYHLLKEDARVYMTPYSYNNEMGITLSIRKYLQYYHEIFLCEMGCDREGEIENLCDFIKPHMAIVSAIGPQHIETFKSGMQGIIKEKMSLVEKLPAYGIAILNRDNEYIRNYPIQNTCAKLWYGIYHKQVDYYGFDMQYSLKGTSFKVKHKDEIYTFHTKLLGEHNVSNFLGAIALAHTLGVSFTEMKYQIQIMDYIQHRMQVIPKDTYTLIDNAYNSNPEGARISLEVMKSMSGQRIIITPGFVELGNLQNQENYTFGTLMKTCVDDVILVGMKLSIPIYKGLKDSGFDMSHVYTANHLQEAYSIMKRILTYQAVVLIENDLPDIYHN